MVIRQLEIFKSIAISSELSNHTMNKDLAEAIVSFIYELSHNRVRVLDKREYMLIIRDNFC